MATKARSCCSTLREEEEEEEEEEVVMVIKEAMSLSHPLFSSVSIAFSFSISSAIFSEYCSTCEYSTCQRATPTGGTPPLVSAAGHECTVHGAHHDEPEPSQQRGGGGEGGGGL